MSGERILVPVSKSPTLRQTVEFAVRRALEDGPGHVHFVFAHSAELTDPASTTAERDIDMSSAQGLLDRAAVWAKEDAGDHVEELTVETGQIGMDEPLFSAEDLARVLVETANRHDIERIVIDPEYDPGIGAPFIRPLEFELTRFDGITVEAAPRTRRIRRMPLLVRSTPVQIGALFAISFLFYQLLAGTISTFDLVTGAISGTIVAVGLSRVIFSRDPTRFSLLHVLRHFVYVPYLLVQIIKSNVLVAAVILHPKLPIDPRLTRVRPAVWGALPITTLANSITLTPGTLTVRVEDEDLVIHTLIPDAREDLFDGGLERAVRFVYYGLKAATIPSPRERGDSEIIDFDRTAPSRATDSIDASDSTQSATDRNDNRQESDTSSEGEQE